MVFFIFIVMRILIKKTIDDFLNEESKIQEDNFIEYIKNKFGFKKLEYINSGIEGTVYNIDDKKVLKITRNIPIGYKNFLNKNFKHLMNVYNIGEITVPKKFITSWSRDYYTILDGNNTIAFIKKGQQKVFFVIAERLYPYKNMDTLEDIINPLSHSMSYYGWSTSDYEYIYYNSNYIFNDRILTDEEINIFEQIIDALKELHENGIKKFDFNTGNILTNKQGQLKLVDYDDNNDHLETRFDNSIHTPIIKNKL